MAEQIKFSSFPSSKSEALAFLYLQNQDLSGLTPTEIYDKYQKAYAEILEARRNRTNQD